MTEVWRTRGPAYHSRRDCQGIHDGQAKAAGEGKRTYPPELVPLASVQHVSGATPCQRCWGHEPGWSDWLPLELKVENHSGAPDGSQYELLFLKDVLMQVPGLNPGYVRAQVEVERRHGAPLRPDFVIEVPRRQPIALEVDGAQKTTVPRPDQTEHSLRRDAELEQLGYRVAHFTNRQVFHEAAWCRQRVQQLLEAVEAEYQEKASRAISTSDRAPAVASVGYADEPRWGLRIFWTVVVLALMAGGILIGVRMSEDSGADPAGAACPSSHPIKGNVSQGGDRIYHAPGWEFYSRTYPEECFATPGDAEDAGYRASEVQ